MTNAELVERVASTMPFLHKTGSDRWYYSNTVPSGQRLWLPFTDANDLFMVLDQFDEYHIDYKDGEFMVVLWAAGEGFVSFANTFSLAVLQAALKACEGDIRCENRLQNVTD